ncbi:MAG: pilus assembly protein PilM [Lentisphaerae bacterium]|nr:pilus assembly protein PilM [Lentisphaerota bacterium]
MALTQETVVGLDIGPDQIVLAQVEWQAGGAFCLSNAAWAPLAPGVDDASIAAALGALWKEARVNCFTVASCLRTPSLAVRHFRFPSLTDEELVAALGLEAEEVLQLDADQIAMDWHENVIGATSGDSRGREGVLVAVPREELARHQRLLETAGLLPVIVDVGCTALGNVYKGLRGDAHEEAAVCVVNMAGRAADVAILFDGNAMYPRALANVGEGEGRDRYVADSLTDVLKYYQFKLRREPVTDIVVTGHAPGLDALCTTIQKRVGMPAAIWDPCKDVEVLNGRVREALEQEPQQGMTLATAMGMAMRR